MMWVKELKVERSGLLMEDPESQTEMPKAPAIETHGGNLSREMTYPLSM